MNLAMSDRSLNIFTAIVIACIFVLLAVNYLPSFSKVIEDPFLTNNGVEGVELYHDNLPYTLNFEQQNLLVDSLNKGEKIGTELIKKNKASFPYSKIVVYQFNKPTITLTPISTIDQNIIFEVPEWNPNGYIQERSGGELLKILSKTFDS